MKVIQHKFVNQRWYLPVKRVALALPITLFSSVALGNSFIFPERVSIVHTNLVQNFADSKSLKSVDLRGAPSLAGFVQLSMLAPQPNLKDSVTSALVLTKVTADGKHARYSQRLHGYKVFGGEVIAHLDQQGVTLDRVTGNFITGLNDASIANKVGIDNTQAIAAAKQQMDASHQWNFNNSGAELVVYYNPNKEGFQPALAYIVNFLATSKSTDPTRPFMVIDAKTGALLDRWEGLNT